MNISSDSISSPYGFEGLISQARARQEDGIPDDLFTSIAEEEEKKNQEAQVGGLSFPNQMTREEAARVESLKMQAQQIASEADGELTPGQEAQIKDIEKQIGEITSMPMGEDLVESAKKQAEANRTEAQFEAREDDPSQDQALLTEDPTGLDLAGQPGDQMLRQNAFITAVRTAGAGVSASGFKSRA